MNFSELVERLTVYGPRGYYLLESFILQLITLEASTFKQNIILAGDGRESRFDAFAPDGFGNISRPVAIEIISSLSIKRVIDLTQIFLNESGSEFRSFLLISIAKVGTLRPEIIKNIINKEEGRIILWGAEEIQALINKHPGKAEELSNALFSSSLKFAIERSSDDWKLQREKIVADISASYQSGRFSIWLGAGVSSSAGLPDWNTLLNSLFVSMLMDENSGKQNDNENISSIVERLRHIDGPSALMLARYIRKGMSAGSAAEQERFISTVTDQLYGLRNQKLAIDSPLIKSIVSLCTPTRTGAKVKTVVTYNFDDLLERQLERQNLSHRSIFEELDMPNSEELPVYHVHGFLPEKRTDYINIDKSTLVFSEEGYHQIYRDAYHWSNLIQLNNLKENTCIMVGLSLTDPNLRRLLEISVKSLDKSRHFAFMKRISLEGFLKENGENVVSATRSTVKKFLQRHHNLNEQVMRELGINIVWYENYDDIPRILSEIGKMT